MNLETSRFGKIEIAESDILHFPEGIIGFSESKKFFLKEHKPGSPLMWMQSAQDGNLAFLVIEPRVFKPDYQPEFFKADLEAIDVCEGDKIKIYATVVVPKGEAQKMSANLLGPIIINPEKKLAKQVVLNSEVYTTCHYILEEMKKAYGVK